MNVYLVAAYYDTGELAPAWWNYVTQVIRAESTEQAQEILQTYLNKLGLHPRDNDFQVVELPHEGAAGIIPDIAITIRYVVNR